VTSTREERLSFINSDDHAVIDCCTRYAKITERTSAVVEQLIVIFQNNLISGAGSAQGECKRLRGGRSMVWMWSKTSSDWDICGSGEYPVGNSTAQLFKIQAVRRRSSPTAAGRVLVLSTKPSQRCVGRLQGSSGWRTVTGVACGRNAGGTWIIDRPLPGH